MCRTTTRFLLVHAYESTPKPYHAGRQKVTTWVYCPDCGIGPGVDHKKLCPRGEKPFARAAPGTFDYDPLAPLTDQWAMHILACRMMMREAETRL